MKVKSDAPVDKHFLFRL